MNLFDALTDDFEFHINKAIMDSTTPVSDLVFRPKTGDTFTSTKIFTDAPISTDTYVIKMPEFEKKKSVTTKTKEDNRTFFDDEMLDFLLKEVMEKKAKETVENLEKALEEEKRDDIKEFSNDIDHVLFNNPWTIVFWKDGSVTRVKCQKGDTYDREKGFAIAVIKHIFGDTNYFNTIFKKWVPEEDK